jgi:hypothetical protein
MAEAGHRFGRSQWRPAFVTGLLRNATTLPPEQQGWLRISVIWTNMPRCSEGEA